MKEKNKFSIIWKLYWLRITVVILLILLATSFIWTISVGMQSFFSMESFYRKSLQASMAFSLYIGIFQALFFASIYMGFHYFFFFGGGMAKLSRKKVKPEHVNIKWKDVVGLESIKKEIWEVIQLIKDRTQTKVSGGKIIKGVLLAGPPGCGKTYLAKAIATETKLPLLHATGSEFQGMFQGMGTSRVKSLFKEARALSEIHGGCIIFIDEIDSIARPRVAPSGMGSGMDYNATVNQLLTEMDGLASSKQNIVVMAATNVSEAELDPALMRAGRFDRKIYVGLPGLGERAQIISYYLEKINYDKTNLSVDKLARMTVGNSPADIANIIRVAALIAQRKKKATVDMSDINEARERIILGIKSEISLSKQDKKIAAYHEAGHTIVTYLLVPTQDVFKASIIPRKAAGGSTWTAEKEERYIPDKEYILGEIKSLLGGYAAEKIKFGSTSAGVGDDLRKANLLAEKMVKSWGMGTSGPGGVSGERWMPSQIAERDKEDIVNNCLDEVSKILRKEKPILDEMANLLLDKEEIDYDLIEDVFKKNGRNRMTYLIENIRNDKKDGLSWDDLVGMDEVKEEAKEIVRLIKDRVAVKEVGGQIIKGLLMFGPPGCGKTYLASILAQEAGVPFITKAGSEFVEMFVGVGASRIRHMFREAREKALDKGGCVIFIDEIDALCAKRALGQGFGGTQEHNQTLNQFLVELDGLKEKDAPCNIVVIGATNVDEAHLDPAIIRPGRFDRKMYISLPTFEERKKIFDYYLSKIKYNKEEIDPEKFSGITPGYSP
ncbi:MAG: AAA family ATPase, partial [Candidatus Omnitrophota bacterium]